jgi:pSer/pThr/pTyr-binding forkhead associated (FHA) protein
MPLTVLFRPPTREPQESASPIELHFGDETIRIGRGSSCELRLPHDSVSELHAVLRPLEGGGNAWTLTDQSSRNGTWVNGASLSPGTPRAVRDGDLARVGGVWLELRMDRRSDTRGNRSTRELALEILGRLLEVKEPTVTVVEGPDIGSRLALREQERRYLVGRSSRCDLELVDQGASREHVRLVRRGDDIFVSDAGAKNGILLGEEAIQAGQTVRWLPSVALRAGGTVLALEVPATLEAVAARVAAEPVHDAPTAATEPADEVQPVPREISPEKLERVVAPEPPSGPLVAVEAAPIAGSPPLEAAAVSPRATTNWGDIAFVAGTVLIIGLAIACIWLILY